MPNLMDKQTEEKLRQGFKYFNRFMVAMWRLGLGQWINVWPDVVGQIMVITHTGRKSGLKRQSPVNYAIIDGEVYCTAGFGKGSDWYRNMTVHPQVEIWLPDGWYTGVAEEITDETRRLPLLRSVLVASGFAARAAGIEPSAISDEALAAVTADYCLMHIRRTAERTGAGGPGELAWVWPLATFVLAPLVLLLIRPRRKK